MISVTRKNRRHENHFPPSWSAYKVAKASAKPASAATRCSSGILPAWPKPSPYKKITVSLPSRATASAASAVTPHQFAARTRSERHRNLKVFLRVPRERCNHAKQRRAKQHCTDHTERDATPQIGESLAHRLIAALEPRMQDANH